MSRNMKKKIVFLPYDFDTAIGINNEGSLTFSYNLEDVDQVGNADVFNGQQSVLWKNLRETYFEELKAMYQQLRSQGKLSYALTETAFEEHQEKWPEALFNEDAWFKYLAPLEEKGSEAYLAMLQGSKAEQRKWWLYNRFKYMDSKYNAGDALTDVITLRGYAKANISVTPYADIYPTVKFGSYLVQERGTRNVATTLVCPLDNVNDTEIYIYSASQLASVGDLSGLKVGYGEFAYATRLQELKIGDSSNSYSNPNLETLYLGNNTLLKKLDVRNCSGLGTGDQKTVDISGCSNIEEVYFDGTNILGVSLPNGGFLKKLHLPGTITNLTVRNQTMVTEFTCPDYSNITTLFLEHTSSAIDVADIVSDMVAGSRIRLFNFYWDFQSTTAVDTFLALFSGMKGMDQNGNETPTPQIFATIHVPSATGDWIDSVHENFPDITIDADVATYYLRYYNMEGDTLLYTETVAKGNNGTYSGTPSHAPTAQYTYVFQGWNKYKNSSSGDSTARNNITSNRNVYAAFSTTTRMYTISFVRASEDGGGTLQTSQVAYGSTPSYTGATPTTTKGADIPFKGWVPNLMMVTGDQTYTAKFAGKYEGFTLPYLARVIEEAEQSEITTIRSNAFYYISSLTTISFPNVLNIESYAFNSCTRITNASFPKVTSIGGNTFEGCVSLVTASFPVATKIGTYAFCRCYSLTTAYFPEVTTISNYAFQSCSALSILYFPAATSISGSTFGYCRSATIASFPVLSSIATETFYGCSSLVTLSFPVAEFIGNYAFAYCRDLSYAYFPSVSLVSYFAFYNCSNLTTISLPTVNTINSSAFLFCSKLTTVILDTSEAIALGTNVFSGTSSDLRIYVQSSFISYYQNQTAWSSLISRLHSISELPN